MPIIIQPPGSGGSSSADFNPLAGVIGVEALRAPAVLYAAQTITPRVALAQANIVSGQFIGKTNPYEGTRVIIGNQKVSWTNFSQPSGFTFGWWMKPVNSANNNATFFQIGGGKQGSPGVPSVRFQRRQNSSNFQFTYQSGGSLVAQARTDSNPWTHSAWNHYALTFSASNELKLYKNGVLLQFDVNTDTGGSTPNNVTSHTFNTAIPSAARPSCNLFGGSSNAGEDEFNGEVYNLGYWNDVLSAAELGVIVGDKDINLAANSGAYVSSSNLQFNLKFASRDATASYVVEPTQGMDCYRVPIGPSVP